MSAIFKMVAKTQYKKWALKIQHCPISSKFDMQISGTTGQNFMKLCGVIDICF
jgi:hypothetical protein